MIDQFNLPDAELLNPIAGSMGPPQQAAIAEMLRRQLAKLLQVAEAQKVLAERLERLTSKLICLTWFLAALTVALLVVEVRAIFFPKEPAAAIQNIQANQNKQVVVPSLTN